MAGHPARCASLVLCAAMASQLRAADMETQHAFDVAFPLKPGLALNLHSRVRTQPGGLGLYQARGGPTLSWNALPPVTLLGGYYYARQERKIDRDFIGGHRFFGGAEIGVAKTRRWSFDQRILTERFLSDSAPDYGRHRLRSRLSLQGTVAPYTAHEFFFDARGWRSNRHSAGVRWSPFPSVGIDLGYLYERRRAEVGPARHVWLTAIQWKPPRRAAAGR